MFEEDTINRPFNDKDTIREIFDYVLMVFCFSFENIELKNNAITFNDDDYIYSVGLTDNKARFLREPIHSHSKEDTYLYEYKSMGELRNAIQSRMKIVHINEKKDIQMSIWDLI